MQIFTILHPNMSENHPIKRGSIPTKLAIYKISTLLGAARKLWDFFKLNNAKQSGGWMLAR